MRVSVGIKSVFARALMQIIEVLLLKSITQYKFS